MITSFNLLKLSALHHFSNPKINILQSRRRQIQSSDKPAFLFTMVDIIDITSIKYCMGGCFGGLDIQNVRDQKLMINKIKTAPDKDVLQLLHDYQNAKALESYLNHLSHLKSLFIQQDQNKDSPDNLRAKGSTYTDRLVHHTQEIISLVKKCDKSRRTLEFEYQNVQKKVTNANEKLNEYLKPYLQPEKKRLLKSQMLVQGNADESINLSSRVSDESTRQKQLEKSKNKITSIIEDMDTGLENPEKTKLITEQLQILISQYTNQISSLKSQINKNQKWWTQKQENQQRLSDILKKQNESLRNQLIDTKKKYLEAKIMIEAFENSAKIMQQEQSDLQKQESSFRSSAVYKKFMGSKIIFNDYKEGKVLKGLIDQIFAPIVIESSHLLFSYDKIRPNNMFEYIEEGKQNLLLLARLENGTIIGGFSKSGFKQAQSNMAANYCFIFSIPPDKQYYKMELKGQGMAIHSVKLDKDYLKFGTNEIRVTCGSNEGKSTLNTKACIFECKKSKEPLGAQEFLGMNRQSYLIEQYQIFQLTIQQSTGFPSTEGLISEIIL